MPPSFAVLVLSAGESRRMGQPKAGLPLYGTPLLEHHVRSYSDAGLTPVVTVLGHQAESLQKCLDLSSAHVVVNRTYQTGQFSSLQTGLLALDELGVRPAPFTGVFLTPVDCPPVPASVIVRMQEHLLTAGDAAAVIPTYKGAPGHPVLLGPAAVRAALTAPPNSALDQVLQALGTKVAQLELTEPAVLWNLNHPDDLACYLKSNPRPTFYSRKTET